ncbi:TPA: type 1 fimbrial protein [Burkholderia cepacia]|uniref:fimbrial protein n=1 Tax=Burkholderia cepacia TaxID=292 RepID=UPI001C615534|nr:fimbrial protein [Burkholderia cepacia]HDR9511647.1 type 1 fimbrial protein [Burkholderia cepacia]
MTIIMIHRERARCLRTKAALLCVAAIAVGASPSASVAAVVFAFNKTMNVPKSSPEGTVLARHYITPKEACGESKCVIRQLKNYPNGCGLAPGPLVTTIVSGVSTRVLVNGKAYASGLEGVGEVETSQPLEVQLIRDNRAMGTGPLRVYGQCSHTFGIGNDDIRPAWFLAVYVQGEIKTIDGTCSVPAQSVKLPNASLFEFGGVGSTVGAHSFQIKVNNCPKGYNQIGYTLDPIGGVIAGSPGVLPLAADSTASGVKIRIADDKGVPATFGTSIKVDAYDTATGGSYAIPMQASYIKTDATIEPGTVNGAMTVLLDYQ